MIKDIVMPLTVEVLVTATIKDGKMTWNVEDKDMRDAIRVVIKKRMAVVNQLGELVSRSRDEET